MLIKYSGIQYLILFTGEDLKYDGYQRGLASVVYKFFDNKNSGSGIKNENISKKELV